MNGAYTQQVRLLLDVLPEVARETCFAMHGGTAINLFVRNMPRLSIDIDLTYVELAQRNATLTGINAALENQFDGMSAIEFSYDEYEATRLQLIEAIRSGLNGNDKAFLLSLNRLKPDWSIYNFQDFPSVKWKLLNLEKFKKESPESYQQQLEKLEVVLSEF